MMRLYDKCAQGCIGFGCPLDEHLPRNDPRREWATGDPCAACGSTDTHGPIPGCNGCGSSDGDDT